MLFFKVRHFDTITSIPAVAAASKYISSSDTADFRCQLSLIARTIPAAAPTLAAAIAACVFSAAARYIGVTQHSNDFADFRD